MTRDLVQSQGVMISDAVSKEGESIRSAVHSEGQKTREEVQAQADRVIDTLDPVGIKRAVKEIRDMATKAGKSVGEFISQNPNMLVSGLGIPLWAARKITAQM